MKRCEVCGQDKPVDAFNRNKAKVDGRQTSCRECDNAASRRYYAANRKHHQAVVGVRRKQAVERNRQIVLAHLADHPCVDCGNADIRVLDFDHVRGVKDRAVSHLVAVPVSVARLRAEIEKCDVRCANCHRIRTSDSLGFYRSVVG